MKKTLLALVTGSLFSVLTHTSSAQLLAANSASKNKEAFVFNAEGNTASFKSTAAYNKAGFKAVKDFNKQFQNQSDVKWYSAGKTITASFNTADIKNTAVYDSKGRWIRNMRVYTGDKMPRPITSLVKASGFSSYEITQVQELQEGGITFYVVHIEDGRGYKKLCVYDREISILQEFDKQL